MTKTEEWHYSIEETKYKTVYVEGERAHACFYLKNNKWVKFGEIINCGDSYALTD